MKGLLISELKRYARRFPNTVKFILDKYAGNLHCRRCGSLVLKETEIKQYPYLCLCCNENLYSFETYESTEKCTDIEVEELVYRTNEVFLLDNVHEYYFLKKIASRILLEKNILLGYELDGSALENEDVELSQFLIRPTTSNDFDELWNHGKEHCSKFTVYLNCDDVFTERRPDLLNYQTKNDLMYGKEDIVAAGKEYNEHVRRSLQNSEKEYAGYLRLHRSLFNKRIKWAIDHLVDVKELGNDRFNIVYED